MAHVLVADDEQQINEVMVDALEAAGHAVISVADGDAALREIQNKKFDIVFLDVAMPRLTGYEVARAVKTLAGRPRVVIVTSRDQNADKTLIAEAGVDAFIPKPFSVKDIIATAERMIKNQA